MDRRDLAGLAWHARCCPRGMIRWFAILLLTSCAHHAVLAPTPTYGFTRGPYDVGFTSEWKRD
ncbi:MAG TPA: hypothetical protein VGO00_28705, partial [Kofleriaceae bacterium]|nr:hypothetical protein [Kofleriaceae bacterium]